MSDHFKDRFRALRFAGKRALRNASSESNLRSLREGISATREQSGEVARSVVHSPITRQVAHTARVAITSGPVVEVAKICGRAGVAGAVVDGTLGTFQGIKAMKDGRIDGKQVLIHTGAEAGCGFVTSTSGTAGTIVAYMITGSMGPAALVAGMGASLGSRYVYRQIIGETLPADLPRTAVQPPTKSSTSPQDSTPGSKKAENADLARASDEKPSAQANSPVSTKRDNKSNGENTGPAGLEEIGPKKDS